MAGKLYIVATPIGNLEDLTFRVLRILKEVNLILCEDTRVTSILLRHYDIKKNTLSYHQKSDERKMAEILSYLIRGFDIALVTDAGTPGISDPGNELIEFILRVRPFTGSDPSSDIRIIPVPGPSAITTALSVSGMNVNKFVFLGFLPKKKRSKLFESLKFLKLPFAFYESPFRILKTLDVLADAFGEETKIFIARELTKIHETLYRGSIEKVREELGKEKVRGEIVVVVEL